MMDHTNLGGWLNSLDPWPRDAKGSCRWLQKGQLIKNPIETWKFRGKQLGISMH